MESKEKILITGVAGLLGSRLADWIIENTDFEVVGIDDLSGGYNENINREVTFYEFDLVDLNALEGVFKRENIKIVYHFAAYAAEGLSPFIRKYNYENNLIASTKKTGTGLGLPIVTKIINEHSSNITVKNKKKENGIIIDISLPKLHA